MTGIPPETLVIFARQLNRVASLSIHTSRFTEPGAELDWRHWVPIEIQRQWEVISSEARLVAFIMAELNQQREEEARAFEQRPDVARSRWDRKRNDHNR